MANKGMGTIHPGTIEGMLDHYWRNLQDDCSPKAVAFAHGVIEATKYLGLISDVEAEGWNRRLERCPDAEDGHGGRSWCAYCGTVKPCDRYTEEYEAFADAVVENGEPGVEGSLWTREELIRFGLDPELAIAPEEEGSDKK